MNKRRRLREDVTDDGTAITLSPVSADRQIDSLLISYEEESMEVPDDIVPEGVSIRQLHRLMFEAPEDEEAEDTTSDDEVTTNEPADALTPKINIDEFTERVATLIDMYTRRLDIETVIFNRARNYIEDEHGEDAAKEFEDILINEHGIDLRQDAPEDPPPDPKAVGGAGPSPA